MLFRDDVGEVFGQKGGSQTSQNDQKFYGGQNPQKMPKYLVLKGSKKFCGAFGAAKKTLYTLIFAFYCTFTKQFFEKNPKIFSKPRKQNFAFNWISKKIKLVIRSVIKAITTGKSIRYAAPKVPQKTWQNCSFFEKLFIKCNKKKK